MRPAFAFLVNELGHQALQFSPRQSATVELQQRWFCSFLRVPCSAAFKVADQRSRNPASRNHRYRSGKNASYDTGGKNPQTGATRHYEGVRLSDVLARAGAPLGDKLRGALSRSMRSHGPTDGYVVVFISSRG